MNIVVWDDLPEGGAKRVVFEQIKGLSKKHKVDYITSMLKSQFGFEKYANSMKRFDMSLQTHKGVARPLQELSFWTKVLPSYRQVSDYIDSLSPDVILVHPTSTTQAPWLLRMVGYPTIYFAEEWPRVVYEPLFHPMPSGMKGRYEFYRRLGVKWVDLKSVEAATKILTTSRYLQSALSKVYKRKIGLLPLGVDTNTFSPEPHVKRSYFLFFGGKEAISGYPLLSQAAAQNNAIVKIVTLKRQGFRYSDREIADLYRRAIATLCLAQNEPFGLTALESMACGTPVIAVNSGGHLDTVRDTVTGLLIDPNKDALEKAMNRLSNDPDLCLEMGANGRSMVESEYTWESHIEGLEKVLGESV